MQTLISTVQFIHSMLLKMMGFMSIIFPWLAPFALLAALVSAMEANYTTLLNSINGLASYVRTMPAAHWLGQANRIVPITEILGMILVELTMRVAAFGVRFIKSWIPTVN